ncbi:MAG: hydroxymethylglutaryl-CoA reductase, degradative [Anaerolineae bacterium]|nr:hydroxymethylglutaryl-CoA reductase, degradative [Anaerolineae bacterium]
MSGFYQLPMDKRRAHLTQRGLLTPEDIPVLDIDSGLSLEQAQHMIENVIGLYSLPLGLALNFTVNGRDILIPMVVEEPSIVAGSSFMAKLARAGGGFFTSSTPPEMIGQMQILDVADPHSARLILLEHKTELLAATAEIDPILKELGGGPRDLEVRLIENSPIGPFLVAHLIYDVRDAMGANAVNTACERLAPQIETITGGRVHLRILSNLADRRLVRARCTIPLAELAFGDFSAEEVRDGIIEAWAFAAVDSYRAATHNKGIMNGIDAVVLATGNDWRAIEAGAHAYATRSGQYASLSTWSKDAKGNLVGTLELPMAVGIVGGATRVHPTAKLALKIMQISSASQLAEIIAAVGLAQNLAALRALATEGIQRGHMNLHARQVAIAAGATGEMIEKIATQMVSEKTVRSDRAKEILANGK